MVDSISFQSSAFLGWWRFKYFVNMSYQCKSYTQCYKMLLQNAVTQILLCSFQSRQVNFAHVKLSCSDCLIMTEMLHRDKMIFGGFQTELKVHVLVCTCLTYTTLMTAWICVDKVWALSEHPWHPDTTNRLMIHC